MLRNYLTIAYRNLKRRPGYTTINLFGLAVGLACCILIALYVRAELSYDDFHRNADRLVLIGMEMSFGGGEANPFPITPYPMAGALERNLPGVKKAVRTMQMGSGEVSLDGQTFFEEEGVFHAGEDFFEMFSFPIVKGRAALAEPNTAVISKELAEKYFPDEGPIGQRLHIKDYGEHTYRITGVARSRDNSYLDFNAVLSFSTLDYGRTHADSWGGFMFLTFARLAEGTPIDSFEAGASRLFANQFPAAGGGLNASVFAAPLPDLYLSDLFSEGGPGFTGQWRYIYLFGAVALFILLLACVNYVNLSTARAMQRAKEVGVRKTAGATRFQLARQFLGEAVLMSAGAFLLALAGAQAALPVFNNLFGADLTFGEAGAQWFLLLGAAALGVGLLAGSYPALVLSAFEPTRVLKGRGQRGRSGAWLRKGLIVVQFAVAIALIVGTAVVYQQLQYVQTKDLGFEGAQVLTTSIPDEGAEALRREVMVHPGVVAATITNSVPGSFNVSLSRPPNYISSETEADTSKSIRIYPAVVGYQYVETLGLEMAAGRQFSREHPSDAERAYILNETAAEALGWTPEEAIGKPIKLAGGGEVIGVVEDYHIESLRKPIAPVVLSLHPFESVSASMSLAARLAPGAIQAGLRHIEAVRAQFTDEPFTYTFLDAEFAEMYRTARRLGQVFAGFAGIAILLACLGLFGLAAYAAERRTKEIGIRKVLGASVPNIVLLLSKDFVKLVLIGFVIAAPLAYYAMQRWLQDFAYRVDLGPWLFVGAGGAALLIALATVSYQAVRAALADPVDALRYE